MDSRTTRAGRFLASLGLLVATVAAVHTATPAAALDPACTDTVLFVAGSSPPPGGDRSLFDAVEGHDPTLDCVVPIAADDVDRATAESYDVVVIASSVRPDLFGDRLADAAVPILVSESYLFDEMSMTVVGRNGELANRTSIRITDATHPLAAGYSGSVGVFTSPARLGYGVPAGAGTAVANTGGSSARSTIFAFETGDMVAGSTAPAGRVGFFSSFGAEFTSAGRDLTHAALDWLLAQPSQTAECGAVITTDITLGADLVDCPLHGLVVGADDITIDLGGHYLRGTAASTNVAGYGIDIRNHDEVTIRNGHIEGFFYGVSLVQSDDNLVEDLTFGGMVHSVEMVAAHRNVLRDLHSNNAQGTALRLTSSHGNTLERVTSGSSRWGVILDRSNDNVVAASRFGGYARVSERGVALDGSSSGNTIRNTETLGWDEHGIAVDGTASGTMLDGNTSYFNDVDGIRIGPDTSDTTIVGNTADDNGEWGIRAFAAVIDGGGNSATGNGLGACDGVVCSAVAPPRGLLVAGSTNPPAGDRPIVSMIEDAGVLLDIVDDDSDLAAIDLLVYDVVFVSTSVVPSKVGATFRGAPVPVMIWEGNLFDEMALSNSGESSQLHTNLVIADAIEPLAGDLPAGSTRVYTDPAPLSFGKPSSDATVIAHEPGRTNRAVLFSYDAGDTLADSAPAPALRVALFPSYAGARSLTATGEQLVAAAIDWVLAGGPPPNDDVADRLPAFVGTTTGDNVGATVEPGERTFLSGLFAESAASVWWEWTSPFDGLARFDTIGSDFRTHLAVGQGAAVDALTVLGAHNGEVEFGSIVAVPVTTGETYLVSVSGMGDIGTGVGDEGDIVLNIREAVPAGNDDFADRVAFVGPTVTGSNVGATLEVEQTPGAGQGGMDGDAQTGSVWWAWTPTVSERIEFDTIGSNFDTILAVWTGDELESLVEVTSNDDCNCSPSNHRVSAVAFDAVAGTTYHVAVYGYRGSSGEIVLNGPA